jgi:hypothetical protein
MGEAIRMSSKTPGAGLTDRQVLRIFLDAIKSRWGKREVPKQLRLPMMLAQEKVFDKQQGQRRTVVKSHE